MLYIHIPFCKGKCIYCDFYSAGNPDWQKYLKALVSELSVRSDELGDDSLHSIYIGGGTPSLIPPFDFKEFMHDLKSQLGSRLKKRDIEITLEANPEDVTREVAKVWWEEGVNRISLGVQSLVDSELKFMRRRHNAEKAIDAIQILKKYFNNISVDLIYGIPNQDISSLEYSLKKIIELEPQHVSAYALTFEPHTPLWLFLQKGKLKACSEDTYIELDDFVARSLSKAGFSRYEISNYSIPGFRSRHNSSYWQGKPYLGIGPSASSYDGEKIRKTNPANLKDYIEYFSQADIPSKNSSNNKIPFYEEERLTSDNLKTERIFTSLRTVEGINLMAFGTTFGEQESDLLMKKAKSWIQTGHLKLEGEFLSLSHTGIYISDHIILDLI